MKLLVIGPRQSSSAVSPEGRVRQALQAAQVEGYIVYTPGPGESNIAASIRMWRQSRKEDFDAVSSQDPFFAGVLAWCIARRAGAIFNVQVHADLRNQNFLRRLLARLVLRNADSVRAVSAKIREQVTGMGVRAPIRVLPVFVDIEKFKSVVHRPHAQKTILWSGRFEEEKDPLFALAILKKVRKKIDARLVMLGAGSLEKALRERAGELPVEFPGWQDPLPYLAEADVAINTSPAESYGAAMVEALAAGVPVVSLDVGVAREAGARITTRQEFAEGVIEAIAADTAALGDGRSLLRLPMLTKEEWAAAWKKTLI